MYFPKNNLESVAHMREIVLLHGNNLGTVVYKTFFNYEKSLSVFHYGICNALFNYKFLQMLLISIYSISHTDPDWWRI
jgi:hypothetical protein